MTTRIEVLNWYKNGFENASAGMIPLLMEDFLTRYANLITMTDCSVEDNAKIFGGIFEAKSLMRKIKETNEYIDRLISHQSKNSTDDALKRVIIDRSIKEVVQDTNRIKILMMTTIEGVIEHERNNQQQPL